MMTTALPTPMRIVLCHKGSDWDARRGPVALALEELLVGDPTRGCDDLGFLMDLTAAIPLGGELYVRAYTTAPTKPPEVGDFLDEVLHTLVVPLIDPELLADPDFIEWLSAVARHPSTAAERHRLIAVARSDESLRAWTRLPEDLGLRDFQVLDFASLGESDERVERLALRLLGDVSQAAAFGRGESYDWRLKLFVSHAKWDGLSVAKSLRDLVTEFAWLDGFYDARSLDSRGHWDKQLRHAVTSSVVVAFRTDAYDHRPWCRNEMRWAEQRGVPIVCVDARHGLVHAPSGLAFELAPCVRILDGNLMRVLQAALRAGARAQLFRRRIHALREAGLLPEPDPYLITSTVGLEAIGAAAMALRSAPEPRWICYPDPVLPKETLEVAQLLAAGVGARLTTPSQLLAGAGGSA
jgi:hypothetical protein